MRIALAVHDMKRRGEAVVEPADDPGWQDPGRHAERGEPERAHRRVAEADLADDGVRGDILDREDRLRREGRLDRLPDAGDEQAYADRPEHEPLADQRHQ